MDFAARCCPQHGPKRHAQWLLNKPVSALQVKLNSIMDLLEHPESRSQDKECNILGCAETKI